jgi:predicted RNA-binding Zn ribbon-like protein
MLWPIVRSAADLLTSDKVHRLKQCAGCGWLLLDESRILHHAVNRIIARRYRNST